MMLSEPVVTFTPMALQHIRKNILEQKAFGFRLAVKKTGCSGFAYVPEIITKAPIDDFEFQQEEVAIFIDKDSADLLYGTIIDLVDHGFGQTKIVYQNPNAANLCGCGESFNLKEKQANE